MFRYIGFYAIGTVWAGKVKTNAVVDKKIRAGIASIVLIALNFILAYYGQITDIIWFVIVMIEVAGVGLVAVLINKNRVPQYFGLIVLNILCIHESVYRIVAKIISIPLQ